MRSAKLLGVVCALGAILGWNAGCSSSPEPMGDPLLTELANPNTPTGGSDGGSQSSTRTDAGRSSTPPPPPSTGSDAGGVPGFDGGGGPPPPPPGSPGQCASQTTADGCFNCCVQAYPGGQQAFQQAGQAFGACVCQTPGTCATQCAQSYCAGQAPQPNDACEQCLGTATQCEQQADQICNATPDCASILSCFGASQCSTKP